MIIEVMIDHAILLIVKTLEEGEGDVVTEEDEDGFIEVEEEEGSEVEVGGVMVDFLLIHGMTVDLVLREIVNPTNISRTETALHNQEGIQWATRNDDLFLRWSKHTLLPKMMMVDTFILKEVEDLEASPNHHPLDVAKTFFHPENLERHLQEDPHLDPEHAPHQNMTVLIVVNHQGNDLIDHDLVAGVKVEEKLIVR